MNNGPRGQMGKAARLVSLLCSLVVVRCCQVEYYVKDHCYGGGGVPFSGGGVAVAV